MLAPALTGSGASAPETLNKGAEEICGDELDNNANGTIDDGCPGVDCVDLDARSDGSRFTVSNGSFVAYGVSGGAEAEGEPRQDRREAHEGDDGEDLLHDGSFFPSGMVVVAVSQRFVA